MATIPLAIQTPTPISPMQNVGQLMQMRDTMSQIALRNAQTQQSAQQTANIEQEAAIKRRDVADQNTIQEMFKSDPQTAKAFGEQGPDGIPGLRGQISTNAYSNLQKSWTDLKLAQETLTKNQLDNRDTAHTQIEKTLTNLMDLDPNSRVTQLQGALQQWNANGTLTAAGMDPQQISQAVQSYHGTDDETKNFLLQNNIFAGVTKNALAAKEAALQAAKTSADTAKANADALESAARKPLIEAEAGLKQLEFKSAQSITPESIRARAMLQFNPEDYDDPAVKAQVLAEQRTAIDAATHAVGREEVNAAFKDSSDRLGRLTSGIASAHAQEPIKVEVNAASAAARQDVLRPDEKITADAIAAGKIAPDTVRAALRRNPGLLGAILTADRNFDESNIDSRYQTLKQFTNTANNSAGGQVIALNTLIHHADLYQQVADSLKNGTFKPGNSVYNSVATMFGSAPPTQTNLVARFLAGETGKVATGGVPAEGEINGLLKSLGSDNSPDQIAKVGKTMLQIAAGRAVPLMEKVKADHLENVVHVVSPDARGILAARGFDPDTLKPASASGQEPGGLSLVYQGHIFTFKDAKTMAQFKADQGIK